MVKKETGSAQVPITAAGDDARKFVTRFFSNAFLREHKAAKFSLVTDWLFGSESGEIKAVFRKYLDGKSRYDLITKFMDGESRIAYKLELKEDAYLRLIVASCAHLEKERCEFTFVQDGVPFAMKLDRFDVEDCCVLEVEAASGRADERQSFHPDHFPYKLDEVSGCMKFYGIQMATTVQFGDWS